MRFYKRNPRRITQQKLASLRDKLIRFGDLGGIVHDLNSDQIISANQRVRVLDLQHVSPVITREYNPPSQTGTVAVGYFEVNGELFSYRAVRWTPEQCTEANLIANIPSGSWDTDILRDLFDVFPNVGMDREWIDEMRRTSNSLDELFAGFAADSELSDETDDQDDNDFTERLSSASERKRNASPVSESIAALQDEIHDDGQKHIVYVVLSGQDWVNFQTLKKYWDMSSDRGLISRMAEVCLNYISASSS